jgi:hypothetical protein
MRELRHGRALTPEQRRRDNARSYAGSYKRRGLLIQQPCACGSTDSQMHHDDYGKPLEVVWMCRPCHMALHKEGLRRALVVIAARLAKLKR